jgi:hypothetical protein
MKFSSAALFAVSALSAPQFPFDATAAINRPNTIMADRISGGPGFDNIDDRDIIVNVDGQNQNALRGGLPYASPGYRGGLPYAGLGLSALPYSGLGYGRPYGGLGCRGLGLGACGHNFGCGC